MFLDLFVIFGVLFLVGLGCRWCTILCLGLGVSLVELGFLRLLQGFGLRLCIFFHCLWPLKRQETLLVLQDSLLREGVFVDMVALLTSLSWMVVF